MIGFIKLQRKIIDWEWYSDINVRITFIHLLLKANWTDSNYKGVLIKRGQIVVGSIATPKEIGISTQQFRTVLKKLKSTEEITSKGTNQFTVVTLINYNDYQDNSNQVTSELTKEEQTNDKPITTSKEDNNKKKDIILKGGKCLFDNSKWSDYKTLRDQLLIDEKFVANYRGVDLNEYIEAVSLWSNGGNKKGSNVLRTDRGWISTLRQFMKGDLEKGSLKILAPKKRKKLTIDEAREIGAHINL